MPHMNPLNNLGGSVFRRATIFTFLLLPSLSLAQAEIKAIQPSCVTDAAGSTSCNVGVNTVPTFASLDGGYQWLTDEVQTTSVSGALTTETVPVFTATQTNFLDVSSVTVINNGAPSTTVETQYVSWITAVPTVNGVVAGAVIAGVVIAPALIGSIQTVADAAAGKTVVEIIDDLTSALGGKAILTAGDLQGLANYILNAVAAAAAYEGAKVLVSAYWTGPTAPLTATQTATTTSSSSSSSTGGAGGGGSTLQVSVTDSSAVPTVTAIMKPPYSNWASILAVSIGGSQIPLSDSDASTPQCDPSTVGVDPGIANRLATTFCTGSSLDFTKSESKALDGSALNPSVNLNGISIAFDYTFASGTCTLNCTASYASMIKGCEYDSHSIYGSANITDDCGTYAMSVTSAASSPSPTAIVNGPRPTWAQSCTPHTSPNVAFTRDLGVDAINRGWSWGAFNIQLKPAGQTLSMYVIRPSNMIFEGNLGWSANQDGCNAMQSGYTINFATWKTLFTAAMDNCDTNTVTAKYGAKPLTWNGPSGCIDVNLWAHN